RRRAQMSRLKYLYLAYFSKPAEHRILYRLIHRHKLRKILEIGFGNPQRSVRMIQVATNRRIGQGVRYAAIDLFEARSKEQPGLALKDAHCLLKPTAASVQLVPGDASSALTRSANALHDMDLVIISADYDEPALAGAWFYLPRMLHAGSR